MPSVVELDTKPVALQGIGAGGYSALDLRRFITADARYEGVLNWIVNGGDFNVTPAAGLSVDVATGEALVQGDSVAAQGLYYCRSGSVVNLTLPTPPDAANPRVDQIVLEVKDTQHDASGLNAARLRIVAGTPTSGATLVNRSGAAALPATTMRIRDLLVPANFAGPFVLATHLQERRKCARSGELAYANGSAGTVSGITVAVDVPGVSTVLPEYDGPIVVDAGTFNMFNATDNTFMDSQLRDGANAVLSGFVGLTEQRNPTGGTGDQGGGANLKARKAAPGVTVGGQIVKLRAVTNAGSGTIDNGTIAYIQALGL